MDNSKSRSITVLGLAIVLIWVLSIPVHLYPVPFFQPPSASEGLAKELHEAPEFIKKDSEIEGMSLKEIKATLDRSIKAIWIRNLFFTILGIACGVMILRRNNIGRIITVGTSLYCVAINGLSLFKHPEFLFSSEIVHMRLRVFPSETIQGWALILISTVAIIYLLLPTFKQEFKSLNKDR